MKDSSGKLACLIAFVCLNSVYADVSEDFDSYPIGNIDAQGPWVDFGGVNLTEVSADFARTGAHSMKLTLSDVNPNPIGELGYGSDVFLDMPTRVREGNYVLSYWTYIPSDFNGSNYAFFSEGLVGAGEFDLGAELIARGDVDQFTYFDGTGGFTLPLIRDRWVEARQTINFDENFVTITYDGKLLYDGAWDIDQQPGGADFSQFRGVNFWVQDAPDGETPTGSMYIDDVFFGVPEPDSPGHVLFAVIFGAIMMHRNLRRH